MNDRQKRQLEFHNGKENIIVGFESYLPLPLEQMTNITFLKDNGYIVKEFKNGLTATVYKLCISNVFYNLKVKREESLVRNVDGRTSFLNEVQRRKDFELLRLTNDILDKGIVKTIYANYRLGIMVSKWIEGSEPQYYNRKMFRNLFELTWNIEKSGIMEWDLCSGNLLVNENNQIILFDFGYMYEHNPLTEYNSEGKSNPLFNSVERFETRAFMPFLLDMDDNDKVLELYKIEKEEAIKIYIEKLDWLIKNEADTDIIETNKIELIKWKKAIDSRDDLKKLYALESVRSYVLDIHDDISGKSCSKATLKKIDKVLEIINCNHEFLVSNKGYLWDDIGLSKDELRNKYEHTYQLAESYLLK